MMLLPTPSRVPDFLPQIMEEPRLHYAPKAVALTVPGTQELSKRSPLPF